MYCIRSLYTSNFLPHKPYWPNYCTACVLFIKQIFYIMLCYVRLISGLLTTRSFRVITFSTGAFMLQTVVWNKKNFCHSLKMS